MSKFRVIASSLNVRGEPSTAAPIRGKLPRGSVVEPTDLSADENWFFIEAESNDQGLTGWIFKDFLVPLEAEAEGDVPAWLEIATREAGVKEVPGAGNNPKILKYHDETSLNASQDSVPWCSSFANWCMKQVSVQGTNSAAARSWLNWGRRLDEPRNGCVVVLRRGSNPAHGHVGFYVGDGNGRIRVLGGNQDDSVKISLYPKSMLLGYRWKN